MYSNHKKCRDIAVLSIGQSNPSEPIDSDFASLLPYVSFYHPLDAYSYSKEELAESFRPMPGEFAVSAVVSDGSRVTISKEKLTSVLDSAIKTLEKDGAKTIVVDCTGDFSDLNTQSANLVLPGTLLKRHVLQDIQSDDKVAILVPIDEQLPPLTERWRTLLPDSCQVSAYTLSPVLSPLVFRELGRKLAKDGNTLIIMDCFGYSLPQAAEIRQGLEGHKSAETERQKKARVYLAKGVTIEALRKRINKA